MSEKRILHLVRHAKSSWDDMLLADIDRPLNQRGLHDAPEMGRRFREEQELPDLVLCSPAVRARQTAELLLPAMGLDPTGILINRRIYEASPDGLLRIIQSVPDSCQAVLIIGHNPSMELLAHALSTGKVGRMPTCAMVSLELPIRHWKKTGRNPGRLIRVDYPKKGSA